MDGIYLDISNMDSVISDLNKLSEKIRTDVALEMNASALNIQYAAKRAAPVNFGKLRNSIQLKEKIGGNKVLFEVGSNLKYAPYVEFGTGGKVSIPNNYAAFANQFKGKTGGNFHEMLKALIEWVKRKGITGTYSPKTQRRTGSKTVQQKQNESAAYAIAISILRKGLRPQPFLIPAFESEKPKLLAKISKIIKNDVKS